MNVQKIKILFSSPIGAFIFLIRFTITWLQPDFNVFVPYRGFYFLNDLHEVVLVGKGPFSSPIGAFIFLIVLKDSGNSTRINGFRPLSGLLFS